MYTYKDNEKRRKENTKEAGLKKNDINKSFFSEEAAVTEVPLYSSSSRNISNLPIQLKQRVEDEYQVDLSDVVVHRNSPDPAGMGALAYAKAPDIYLGPGAENCLSHELAHIIQQKQGRVAADGRVNGMPVNTSHLLEREADSFRLPSVESRGPRSEVIQGDFVVNLIPFAGITADANNKLFMLRNDLTSVYGPIFPGFMCHIDLIVDPGVSASPAFTRMSAANTIEVHLTRWFLERCTYGELLGMVNHELNVHKFANIAIVAAGRLATGAAPVNILGTAASIGQRGMRPSTVVMASHVSGSGLPFTPGDSPGASFGMPDMPDHYGYEADMTRVTMPVDLTMGMPSIVKGKALNIESPATMAGRGGQMDHAFMSHVRNMPEAEIPPLFFSPRALVYAQMTLRIIDCMVDRILGHAVLPAAPVVVAALPAPLQAQVREAQKNVEEIMRYHFLDLARTWHEELKGTWIQDVFMRNLLFTFNGDSVEPMAQEYLAWLLNPGTGIPNAELNVAVMPNTQAILQLGYNNILGGLTGLRGSMFSLMGRGVLSILLETTIRRFY